MSLNKCPVCFKELSGEEVCPECGAKVNNIAEVDNCLPLFTVVGGRFEIGTIAARDKYCIEYYAFDKENNDVCRVTEFFPQQGAQRAEDKVTVVPLEEHMKDYKFSFRRFKERTAILEQHSNLEAIIPLRKSFAENETYYYASDVVKGKTLRSYTNGAMKAAEAFEMIKPVVTALGVLHNAGIIHRGVSPDTIIVTEQGKLVLTGLEFARDCLSRSELTVMLKSGYSAPEQYSSSGQGPWTDVYGICATIYWLITGSTPPDFFEVQENKDALVDLSSMAYGITAEQNNAIMKGLKIKAEERWQNVTELEKALYEGINSVSDPNEDNSVKNTVSKEEKKDKPPYAIIGAAAAAVIIIIALILLL